jgi:hypothetical protein
MHTFLLDFYHSPPQHTPNLNCLPSSRQPVLVLQHNFPLDLFAITATTHSQFQLLAQQPSACACTATDLQPVQQTADPGHLP